MEVALLPRMTCAQRYSSRELERSLFQNKVFCHASQAISNLVKGLLCKKIRVARCLQEILLVTIASVARSELLTKPFFTGKVGLIMGR